MELTDKELKIQEEAIQWVKKNENNLIKKFILDKNIYPVSLYAIFMAGSPGVGKTEYSEEYVKEKNEFFRKTIDKKIRNNLDSYLVRLDVDEIRNEIPFYQKSDLEKDIKGNSYVLQRASNLGIEVLRKYCIKNNISFLLDGTFGNQFSTFNKMIIKLKKQDRKVIIMLIFGDYKKSWEFTKAREWKEGRKILKEKFIEQYLKSTDNVRRIKEKFKNEVQIDLILKKEDNSVEDIYFNIDLKRLEKVLEERYNISNINNQIIEDNIK